MGKFIKNTVNNIHIIEEIAPNTYRLDEAGLCNSYLVIGDNKALLIDNGNGAGNILKVAESLTKLPIETVATHMHPDHVGGRNWFKYFYVDSNDNCFTYKALCIKKANEMMIKMRKDLNLNLTISKKAYHHSEAISIADGHDFELGNRHLKVVEVPGHTKGSIALLDDKEKIMFTGDSGNPWIWLQLPGSTNVSTWLKSVDKLIELSKTYKAYYGHGDGVETKKDFIALKELGNQLLKEDIKKLKFTKGKINYPDDDMKTKYHIYTLKKRIK